MLSLFLHYYEIRLFVKINLLMQCDPNLVVYSVWIDTLDKRLPRLAFFTTRSISIGEELTFDYQMNKNCDHSAGCGPKMPCLCGSKNCLGFMY